MKVFKTSIMMIIIAGVFLLFAGILSTDEYNEPDQPSFAPQNPKFVQYMEKQKLQGVKLRAISSKGHPLGYIPSPVDMSHVKGMVDKSLSMATYASKYDLRTTGRLTSIRNQGDCGSCWTFGTMASVESFLKPTETRDFSEQHLNANHGFDNAECDGGNQYMSTAYLSRWSGPLNESDVPYPYDWENSMGISNPEAYTIQKHIQQVIFLPDRTSYTDNNTVKYFLTNYGAVAFSFYYDDPYYNSTNKSYYYSGSEYSNHMIAVVGWDDGYSASKFGTTPPGNGAFICRNSWSSSWGESGYFYISYYDKSIEGFTSFNNAESNSNYAKVYQYDTLGWVQDYGWSTNKVTWAANIFTTTDSNSLKAVSFYLNDSNAKYDIYIYKGIGSGKPRSGTLAAQKSGSKTYPGYYTVELTSAVSLTSGTRFSVVIKFTNSTSGYAASVESPMDDYSSNATASSGQSYLSSDGTTWTDITTWTANTNLCIKAFTGTGSSSSKPTISVNRKKFNFGGIQGGSTTGTQSFRISNSGTGTLNWTLTKSSGATWLTCTPSSGTNTGTVSMSVNTSGLTAGSYSGTIDVKDSNATNSPQTVTVNLTVKKSSSAQNPFGDYATPADLSTVYGSVPFTGWVLDDIQVSSVKMYNGSTYIGDAVFIEGARPDVETAYPTYPFNYKAGWGYMLLTNFLPNKGNGWYTIYAKATDKEGHVFSLGFKNIYCDNAHAVKPFGAIDTPTQGGTASGKSYVNWGWALTPKPNTINTSGSTIDVIVDGVIKGHPTYNIKRDDIVSLFPNYNNTNGAVGYYYLDTTKYSDGTHTIAWSVKDNVGNADGIGSRFFTIQNTSSLSSQMENEPDPIAGNFQWTDQIKAIPADETGPVWSRKGYNDKTPFESIRTVKRAKARVFIREDERVEIKLKENPEPGLFTQGFQVVGDQLKPLPIGSTLDKEKAIFYWQPSAGFVGDYEFVFISTGSTGAKKQKEVQVKILPKFSRVK